MMMLNRPMRCSGKVRPDATSCGLIGMGMARPRCSTARERHRPSTSSPCPEWDRRERVKQRQKPCPHRTRTTSSAASHMLLSDHVERCRQVLEREAKQRPWTDSLTPVPRKESAADPRELRACPCVPDLKIRALRSRQRAKCVLRSPEPDLKMESKTMGFSRKQREAARVEAKSRLGEIPAMEVRVNDEIGSHITVFKPDGVRVDWWPGARHWREGAEDFNGEIDEFFAWLKGANPE